MKPSLPTNLVAIDESERQGFMFLGPKGSRTMAHTLSWSEWADYNRALGQELAKRMRGYGGPAEQDDPPPGGQSGAMRMAA